MTQKYRISDFFLDLLKQLGLLFGFHLVGFIAYALTAGHIMRDELVDIDAKRRNLVMFSLCMLAALAVFMWLRMKNDVGRKAKLIEASRADDFDAVAYYRVFFICKVVPFTSAFVLFTLPYSVFYMFCGYGYQNALVIERFFSASVAGTVLLGGVLGALLQSIVMGAVYAAIIYKIQKRELDDRMWLKDAERQKADIKPYKPQK